MKFRTPLAVVAAGAFASTFLLGGSAAASPSGLQPGSVVCIKPNGKVITLASATSFCPGTKAVVGPQGQPGADGLSAYQLARRSGFAGSLGEWLTSLKGAAGAKGDDGAKGLKGDDGAKGDKGAKGDDGTPGPKGAKGDDGAKGDGFPTSFKLNFHQDGTYACTWVESTATFDCPKV